ncbi:hypothetical protein [Pseudomonas syringae]|uniref:Uncharacterized protein n=1 Tax=Pseudomonas syringae pv. actinidifoliorum ICMP 18803 TaxID=1194400 RepID=A0AAT9SBT2_PSESX|nr:hypothetical protein [Pseudomonas syringae]EPM66130.1 hypothetical protein A249_40716 [Pseudomonas syringae pv. actinidiae ICMP 18804]UYS79072.1 hypothetical protein A237_016400 [Pseudomonas syringae pv. actinidifoliorum ICMP 18803]
MSNQFKPGDLALTIYPIPSVEAGSVVLLDRRLEQGSKFTMSGITFQALEVGWLCSKPGLESPLAYAESSLMPLRGDAAPADQKSRAVPA